MASGSSPVSSAGGPWATVTLAENRRYTRTATITIMELLNILSDDETIADIFYVLLFDGSPLPKSTVKKALSHCGPGDTIPAGMCPPRSFLLSFVRELHRPHRLRLRWRHDRSPGGPHPQRHGYGRDAWK